MIRRTPEDDEEWRKECKRLAYNPDDDADECTTDDNIRNAWRILQKIADYLNETYPKTIHGFALMECTPTLKFEVHNIGIRAEVYPVVLPEAEQLTALKMTASASTLGTLLPKILNDLQLQMDEISRRNEERQRQEEEDNAWNAT